jgi:hypothetical protein
LLGYVEAADAESAIAKAIEQFKITDEPRQRRQKIEQLNRRSLYNLPHPKKGPNCPFRTLFS